jgi:hypothetical protein
MRENGITDAELSRMMNKHPLLMARKRSIGQRSIAAWRKGAAMPHPIHIEVLRALSDGQVTADSFLDGIIKDEQSRRARKAKKPTKSVRRAGARRDDVQRQQTSCRRPAVTTRLLLQVNAMATLSVMKFLFSARSSALESAAARRQDDDSGCLRHCTQRACDTTNVASPWGGC